ncbi:MAG: hypothetical protein KDB52_00650 [Solirubrobacterales bacterium]|nr:hypothetical protein [Solirubrobacterales bacterium]
MRNAVPDLPLTKEQRATAQAIGKILERIGYEPSNLVEHLAFELNISLSEATVRYFDIYEIAAMKDPQVALLLQAFMLRLRG